MESQNQSKDIDEGLYSRQLYVLGHDAMKRLGDCNVLVSCMRGLGAEVAKDVVLAGPRSVTIHDTQTATWNDLSSQFFLTEEDIGKNRAMATQPRLQELNSYVCVTATEDELNETFLSKFTVVVLTQASLEDQLKFGSFCHQRGIHFIAADSRGVFGQIFCDLGENFVVLDMNGEVPFQYLVRNITQDKNGVVTCCVRHGFLDGEYVKFSCVRGMDQLNDLGPHQILKVIDEFSFTIDVDTTQFGVYIGGGNVTEAKMPQTMSFQPMSDSLSSPKLVYSDYRKLRQTQLHLAFQAFHTFTERHSRQPPRPHSEVDADEYEEIFRNLWSESAFSEKPYDSKLIRSFSFVASADIVPIQSIVGGVTAQEVIKACTGKFTPISQWWYFDAVLCLPTVNIDESSCSPRGCRYDGQIAAFGDEFQRKLNDISLFVVGAGAIGCELLKNLAMMGVACGETGKITLTDMDLIEKSNLNRQFLFRPHDLQKLKSSTAAEAVKKMNPAVRVEAHANRVGPETEFIYDDDFFDGLTAVMNALDNVPSRLYVDRRCLYFRKPLFECGTLGAKGCFQSIIPDVTEPYSARPAPKGKEFPVCTIKHFPSVIEHTLHWARSQFEEIFAHQVRVTNEYLADPRSFIEKLSSSDTDSYEKIERLTAVKSLLIDARPKSFDDCVTWSVNMWYTHYHDNIQQILCCFPPNHKTKTGAPFWSGTLLCPHPLTFDCSNKLHVDYVTAAANLLAEVFGIAKCRDDKRIMELTRNVQVATFTPNQSQKIDVTDEELKERISNMNIDEEELQAKLSSLPDPSEFGGGLRQLEFEKDDDTNFHMDFITAASNLRAENYGIQKVDRNQSKLIAGRIIPAIATTTAVVAGFVCLELYKLLQGHQDISQYQTGSINLGVLKEFCLSKPSPPKSTQLRDGVFTLWDHISFDYPSTVGQLVDYFKTRYGLTADVITYEKSAILSCLVSDDKRVQRLAMPLNVAVETVSKHPLPPYLKSIELHVNCVDETIETDDGVPPEVEVPPIKYNLRITKVG